MRLLVVTDRYPPHYTGGYEIACYAVIERLRQRGHEVVVLTSNYGLRRTKVEGHAHRLLHRPQDAAGLLRLVRWQSSDHKTLWQLVREWKPDVIYAWSMLQLFPSLYITLGALGRPVVFNVQDLWLPKHLAESERWRDVWLGPGANPVKDAVKIGIRTWLQWQHPEWLRPVTVDDVGLSRVIFCSCFRQEQHVEVGLPLGESRVMYNGVDPCLFHGTLLALPKHELRVLFVGRLVYEKGAHTAIQAVAELVRRGCRQVQLSIAGVPAFPWDYAVRLHTMVETHHLQDHVHFLGTVPNQDMPDVYRQHHILAFPSICDEGCPVTLLEAMSCGLVVVGTTTGGSAEILENGLNSLTFPADDSVALADCLARLMDNPEMARGLASAGQTLVREQFHIESIVNQTEDYLQGVMDGHMQSVSR